MVVHEFIEWLKGFEDQDATVQIVCEETQNHGYENYTNIYTRDFDPSNPFHIEYTDMRNNKFAIGKPYQDSHTLLIGSRE